MQRRVGSAANRGYNIEPDRGHMNLWDRILASLQAKMNSQAFNTWLRPTQQLSVADGLLHVEVPSVHFADWIHNNYMPLIQESARELEVGDLRLSFSSREAGARHATHAGHGGNGGHAGPPGHAGHTGHGGHAVAPVRRPRWS